MTKHSTHVRWKGHCMLEDKWRCNGARRVPWNVMRKLGKKRRLTNKRLDDDDA